VRDVNDRLVTYDEGTKKPAVKGIRNAPYRIKKLLLGIGKSDLRGLQRPKGDGSGIPGENIYVYRGSAMRGKSSRSEKGFAEQVIRHLVVLVRAVKHLDREGQKGDESTGLELGAGQVTDAKKIGSAVVQGRLQSKPL